MDTRSAIVLRHKPTGLYFSKMADHTKSLWGAWRFRDEQELETFFKVHSYAPDHPEQYESVAIRLSIELESEKHGIISSS